MKLYEVLVCTGLVLLATKAHAGIVPTKASLSLKDKLAFDIPVKQLIADKTGEKSETVKVGFPTTPPTTRTTSATARRDRNKPQQRPKYIDATVFRHQFTTPSSSSITASFSPVDDPSDVITYFTSHRIPESIFSPREGELGLVTDRKSESFRRGFVPLIPQEPDSSTSGETVPSTIPITTSTPTYRSTTATTTSTSSLTNLEFSDYDTRFRFMDDHSPFRGELGILGSDRKEEGYMTRFRPLGFR